MVPRIAIAVLTLLAASPALATWAIVLTDTATGEVGIGQATCVAGIDLRALSAVIVTERGVATVQAAVDSSGVARSTIREELLAGTPPAQILQAVDAADPAFETHQYCIVDTAGGAATYTGTSAQGFSFAGGQTGQSGSIRYCVAGNLLTGDPVVAQAVQALEAAPGGLADKLVAGMEAARAMGGDGRCSCSPSNPTGCGSPPPSFARSAINGYLVVARIDDTPSCAACSGGEYWLDLAVAFQGSGGTDPVLLLEGLYDAFRDELQHRPDAVRSVVTLDPAALAPDGVSSATMRVELLDLDGAPIGVPLESFAVEHAAQSDAVTTIGVPVDQGGGVHELTLTAGTTPGLDVFRVTADDGIRPVVLMPRPRLPVDVTGEVGNARWATKVRLEWDAVPGAVSYHVYRGELEQLECTSLGECRDAFDPDTTDLKYVDFSTPASGAGFGYLVTSEGAGGSEGPPGSSACGVREITARCGQ